MAFSEKLNFNAQNHYSMMVRKFDVQPPGSSKKSSISESSGKHVSIMILVRFSLMILVRLIILKTSIITTTCRMVFAKIENKDRKFFRVLASGSSEILEVSLNKGGRISIQYVQDSLYGLKRDFVGISGTFLVKIVLLDVN